MATKPGSVKATAKVQAEIRRLAALGHSVREISAALGGRVGKSTVGSVLKAAAATPSGPSSPPPPPSPGDAARPAAAAAPNPADDLDFLERQLGALRKRTEEAAKGSLRAHITAVRAVADLTAVVAKLRPVPPPDPNIDPANLAARAAVRERIARLVASERAAAPAPAPADGTSSP